MEGWETSQAWSGSCWGAESFVRCPTWAAYCFPCHCTSRCWGVSFFRQPTQPPFFQSNLGTMSRIFLNVSGNCLQNKKRRVITLYIIVHNLAQYEKCSDYFPSPQVQSTALPTRWRGRRGSLTSRTRGSPRRKSQPSRISGWWRQWPRCPRFPSTEPSSDRTWGDLYAESGQTLHKP